ncbi:MAG: chorismate synthase [Candidatus Omnitrophota bacterium]
MLRFLTAGESHGKCLVGILEGMPSGLRIEQAGIDRELARRQKGYGRGGRMKIEKDKVAILSGVRKGRTLGSPIALMVENKDFSINTLAKIVSPRPGHADLAGALKYNTADMRDILERASARETAMRVAIGALCKALIQEIGVDIVSHVLSIGKVCAHCEGLSIAAIHKRAEHSLFSCADKKAESAMKAEIDRVKDTGDTLGGILEVIAVGVPFGLGSLMHWDRRLDSTLAGGLMSIPAVKGVEIGAGFIGAFQRGSQVHDPIFYSKALGFWRKTNHAGGLEGGMTNGQPVVIRCAMKPIATLGEPLASVNIKTKQVQAAAVERADVCAVAAAAVVAESVVSFCLAQAGLEKFGGDSLGEFRRNYQGYLKQVKAM